MSYVMVQPDTELIYPSAAYLAVIQDGFRALEPGHQ